MIFSYWKRGDVVPECGSDIFMFRYCQCLDAGLYRSVIRSEPSSGVVF